IVRRYLFDDADLSNEDRMLLSSQGIEITSQMRALAARLRVKSRLDFWSNAITISVFSGTSICIASFRTWHLLLALDPLTVCMWLVGYLSVLLSVTLAVRKRIR